MIIFILCLFLPSFVMAEDDLKNFHTTCSEKEIILTDEEHFNIYETIYKSLKEERLLEAEVFLNKVSSEYGVKELVKDKLYYRIDKIGNGKLIGDYPAFTFTVYDVASGIQEPAFGETEPTTLYVKSMIDGFGQGVAGMKEGEVRTLYIHPDLAYGLESHIFSSGVIVIEAEVIESNVPDPGH